MGGHMAANLAKNNFPLVVHDISTANIEKLTAQYGWAECNVLIVALTASSAKIKVAKNPKEVAAQVQHVITMLPSSPHVQQVYSGGTLETA
jgi:3-hydroxyisobutyrate dehydrogenase-like beta-hydroxyacid dehydrogenase